MYICVVFYLGFTFGCAFSPDINALIVFRALQGFVVGCSIASVQGIISDMYAPAERGSATGAFLIPVLVGPVIAPLIGGALTQSFSWRANFYLLLGMGAAIGTFAWFTLTETLHFLTGKKEHAYAQPPKLINPLRIVLFLTEADLAAPYAVQAACFGGMFASLTSLPLFLAQEPYNQSASIIGLSYLPVGVAMLVGAFGGGVASDRAAVMYPEHPSGRLVFGLYGMPTDA